MSAASLARKKARAGRRGRACARRWSSFIYSGSLRPDLPVILSLAHDVLDGSLLHLITDRPCLLLPDSPPVMPLVVNEGLPPALSILSVAQELPNKFLLSMDNAVPAGAPWRWLGGASSIVDAKDVSRTINPGEGFCADVPGPYTPPPVPEAHVVSALAYGDFYCDLLFDRPVPVVGSPDDAIVINGGVVASSVEQPDSTTLRLNLPMQISPGGTWQIVRAPAWISVPVAMGSGMFS